MHTSNVCFIGSPVKIHKKIESSELNMVLELIEMGSGGKIPVNFPVKSFWWLFIHGYCMHNK